MLEPLATVLGLVNQWLTIRRNIWCWPVGIASVALFAVVFLEARLYSDMLLQGVYVALQIYGWRTWLAGGPARTPLPVSSVGAAGLVRAGTVALLGGLALGAAMRALTDASLPWLDATATAASLVAQWLQARKVLESWLVFIVANLLFMVTYAMKNLWFTLGLFSVLTALAVVGFVQWRHALRASGHN